MRLKIRVKLYLSIFFIVLILIPATLVTAFYILEHKNKTIVLATQLPKKSFSERRKHS